MHTSSRFAVAVHAMSFIAAHSRATAVTSDMVAASVNTNPVVIRRVLGILRQAHLVASQLGSGGGWTLTRQPDTITLRDIYCAIQDAPLLALPQRPANARCNIGKHMQQVLFVYFTEADRAMQDTLAGVTVAQVMLEVDARVQGAGASWRAIDAAMFKSRSRSV